MLEAFLVFLLVLGVTMGRRYRALRAPRVEGTSIRRAGRDRGSSLRSMRPGLPPGLALLALVGITRVGGGTSQSSTVVSPGSGAVDHGLLQGLADDDHTQYFRADGARALGGSVTVGADNTHDIATAAARVRAAYLRQLLVRTGIAIGNYSALAAGRRLAIALEAGDLYGLEVTSTIANTNPIAAYAQASGVVAVYGETSNSNFGGGQSSAFRGELYGTNYSALYAFSAYDSKGVSTEGFRYQSANAGGTGAHFFNAHEASPTAGFTGLLIEDNQQSGATSNVGADLRTYQDSISAIILRDSQRSLAQVLAMKKDVSGGYLEFGANGANLDTRFGRLAANRLGGTSLELLANLFIGDTISERTAAAGVTVDGCLIKDGQVRPATTTSLNAAAPSFGSGNTVTAGGGIGRHVFGNCTLAPTASQPCHFDVYVEDSVGAGTYTRAQRVLLPASTTETAQKSLPYSVLVPTGRRYYFDRSGNVGVTETNSTYNYVDV